MANPALERKTFETVQEKYAHFVNVEKQVLRHGMVWATNPGLDQPGAPVLIQLPSDQFKMHAKQGYVKYVHTKKADEPVEAKKVNP